MLSDKGAGDRLPFSYVQRSPSRRERVRRILPALLVSFIIWSLFRTFFVQDHHYDPSKYLTRLEEDDVGTQDIAQTKDTKIALEAHIMSKCPDAKDGLRLLVVPAMAHIYEKVNFTLSYIGRCVSGCPSLPRFY